MLDTDPEFYLKWVAICEASALYPIRMMVVGDMITIKHKDKTLGEISTSAWFKASPEEIMKLIGVPKRERII